MNLCFRCDCVRSRGLVLMTTLGVAVNSPADRSRLPCLATSRQILLQRLFRAQLKILPNGGHMGYLGTKWAKTRIQKLFE